MKLLYNLFVQLYGLVINIASWFNPKAKNWVNGRKGWKNDLRAFVNQKPPNKPVVWIHAASLGEFEQGRPIIEKIKQKYSEYSIVLTFFSPSGYEIRKDYPLADYVCYLPLDTASNANAFVSILQPKVVLFIKYEFWFNYLNNIHQNSIPLFLVSGIFRKDQSFFKPYGSFFRKGLKLYFTHFYVQDENSRKLLNSINISKVTVAGDTRFDRVMDIKSKAKQMVDIQRFASGRITVILGSSWPKEEAFLLEYIKNSLSEKPVNFIIAPHNIEKSRLIKFQTNCLLPTSFYSKVKGEIPSDCQVLIIDSIGLLSSIYAYSDIAIIGGGFGAGIHNILEAAVWGQPVMFGPNYTNFNEAINLLKVGGANTFKSQQEFTDQLSDWINDEQKRREIAEKASQFCISGAGAVDVVMKGVFAKQIL